MRLHFYLWQLNNQHLMEINRKNIVSVCYNKLWKILIDRGMSKTDLIKASKNTANAMGKRGCKGGSSG